jgi:hypothetical protein
LRHHFDAQATVDASRISTSDFRQSSIAVEHMADGSKLLKGVRIFKTGNLTDSLGRQKVWTQEDLVTMAENFSSLRNSGVFMDVPIRSDHSTSVKDLVGYFFSCYVDPSDPNFLCADLQITEPDAFDKWRRKTYRNRSLEVGRYTDNEGNSLYPTVMGLAFVDIPAVEGLHNKNVSEVVSFSQVVVDPRESAMPDINTDPQGWTAAVTYAAWVEAATFAQACADWEAAAIYAKGVEEQFQPPAPAPGITPPAAPAPATFRVAGEQVQDYSRVQAHIDALEGSLAEIQLANRQAFVKGLAEKRQIAATQIDSLTALALTMNPEQFNAFRAGYENAPAVFQVHGQQQDPGQGQQFGGQGTGNGNAPEPNEIETAKDIVANSRRAGMPEAMLKESASFQKLVKAGIESA